MRAKWQRGRVAWVVVWALVLLAAPIPARAQEIRDGGLVVTRSARAQQVDRAIERARGYLLSTQNPDGSWTNGGRDDSDGGRTSLVLLALLSAGEPVESEPVQNALRHLRTIRSRTTYGTGLRAAALSMLPERMRKLELPSDLRWLIGAAIDRGPHAGMYTYVDPRDAASGGDYSNSQYGVLGVWYAAEAGLEVPTTYWRAVEEAWKKGQQPDGGWGYTPGGASYASMTAAGAATLAITEEFLGVSNASELNRLRPNADLDRAIAWLGEHFRPDRNAGPADRGQAWLFYMLFGVERVGEATGLTRFGDRKWFDEGADHLVSLQRPDGSFRGDCGPDADTAYALLFLSRGNAPVAIQKLRFDGRWNNRPLDARRISRWIRGRFERFVNWQVVDADAGDDELLEAPILLIASDRMLLKLGDTQKQSLRRYLDRGGLILAVNEGPRDDLARSMRNLMREWYPTREWRELSPTHPLRRGNFDAFDHPGKVLAIGNGVRDLVVLLPDGDLTWRWHVNAQETRESASPFSVVGNLYASVTDGLPPLRKGESTWIAPVAAPGRAGRSLRLARLQYGGHWDPEPAAWERVANALANERLLDLSAEPVKLDATLTPDRHPVAHLAAAEDFAASEAERRELRRYLDAGGFLLADAAGGATSGAVAIERLLAQLYPAQKLAPLPADHPVYRATRPGMQRIDTVGYRRHAMQTLRIGELPRLQGLTIDGRLVAIVSGEDLSAGLVGYARDGIVGYTPASSLMLVRNVLLWKS
jgi:hypothetical protein